MTEALQACVVGVVITDALQGDHRIVYANPAFEHLTGFSQAEVLGRNCRFLQGEDRQQPGLENLRQALAQGHSVTVILRNYRRNGTLFHNELTLSPIRNAEGQVTHYLGFQNDVTEREQAKHHAAELSSMISSTIDRVTDGVTSLNRHGVITYVNASAASMAGKTPADLIGHRLLEVFPTAPTLPLGQAILRAQNAMTPWREEAFLTELQQWIEVTVYPAQDGVSIFTRDVTESHQARVALQRSEQRVSTIFEASPMPVALTRLTDRVFLDANLAFEHLSGYRRDEVIGRPSPELNLWVHDAERLEALQAMADGHSAQRRVVSLRSKSGQIRDCFISFVPIEIAGEPCVISLVQDVTEENRVRRAMEDSEARSRRLAADMQRTLDMSLDLITSFDSQGRFLTVSASSTEILGYTPEELIGRPYLELVHPEDRAMTVSEDEIITEGHPTAAFRNRYLQKDGTVVWLEWAAVVLPGDPTMYCVARDITHRRTAEVQIQELNRSLQHQLRQLTGLRDIDRAISSGLDFSLTLRMIIDHLMQVLSTTYLTCRLKHGPSCSPH
ncbi:PAS domain S-box protein [Deinococcus sp. QL22]|uniref:PAS domain-containing protein n=1 Tax=Deinococcus sp. QL22 TaxID=2939437 RepID=UPI002017B4E4|nr:PAS domain S-box protein [Deinococcus sp. QL22]UQN10151.1 PAS domain S-box protein [Deinococcus sp. QL22]